MLLELKQPASKMAMVTKLISDYTYFSSRDITKGTLLVQFLAKKKGVPLAKLFLLRISSIKNILWRGSRGSHRI